MARAVINEIDDPVATPAVARVDGLEHSVLGTRQCVEITRTTGIRCQRPPTPGGTRCRLHGDTRGPIAKQNALRLLLSTVEPAMELLMRTIDDGCAPHPQNPAWCSLHGSTCPEWSVRVSAAKALLDRAGYGPHAKLTIEKPSEDLSDLDTTKLANELEALTYQLRARNAIDLDPGQYSPRMNEADNANIMPVDESRPST